MNIKFDHRAINYWARTMKLRSTLHLDASPSPLREALRTVILALFHNLTRT